MTVISKYRCQKLIAPLQIVQRKVSTSEEPTSEVPSYYDRFIFPHPPDLVSDEEHDSMYQCLLFKNQIKYKTLFSCH